MNFALGKLNEIIERLERIENLLKPAPVQKMEIKARPEVTKPSLTQVKKK